MVAILDGDRAERLGGIGEELGERPGAGEGHRHRQPDGFASRDRGSSSPSAGSSASGAGSRPRRTRRSSSIRRRGLNVPTSASILRLSDLVPAEVPLHVHPVRALHLRLPDRLADLHAERLHRVVAGDDAGPLIPENADREAGHPGPADGFGGGIEGVGVAEPDES